MFDSKKPDQRYMSESSLKGTLQVRLTYCVMCSTRHERVVLNIDLMNTKKRIAVSCSAPGGPVIGILQITTSARSVHLNTCCLQTAGDTILCVKPVFIRALYTAVFVGSCSSRLFTCEMNGTRFHNLTNLNHKVVHKYGCLIEP